MINLFQHRDDNEAVKLRTFSDCMGRIGGQISNELGKTTERILKMYGFDSETGLPVEGACLPPASQTRLSQKRLRKNCRCWEVLLEQ